MITVRTFALNQAVTSLAMAGCLEATISLVPNAVKVEGIKEGAEPLLLYVWSKEAEDTASSAGRGKKLTAEQCQWLDQGKCPVCEDHQQLYKEERKEGLALVIYCDAGHRFWIPPAPLEPEYLEEQVEVAEVAEEVAEEAEEVEVEPVEEVTDEASDTA